ncbi:hypothetical protein K432DRAFT_38408 [Lepidopterella palustris CBS 459.81]|uniref:Uncharacterized protein n=1 Tax=Lepidopterella palustris CBS 459.81 TaxID=1314670 RepID=A0A8E2EBR3_9PEZI|nr:hypothetical protein K432DRAFT_38408 [Lepidopterella palustris CBS 459.81]
MVTKMRADNLEKKQSESKNTKSPESEKKGPREPKDETNKATHVPMLPYALGSNVAEFPIHKRFREIENVGGKAPDQPPNSIAGTLKNFNTRCQTYERGLAENKKSVSNVKELITKVAEDQKELEEHLICESRDQRLSEMRSYVHTATHIESLDQQLASIWQVLQEAEAIPDSPIHSVGSRKAAAMVRIILLCKTVPF